jgi:RNA polymerase sigma factor (sigma-70 family)
MSTTGTVQEVAEAFERCRRRYPTIALDLDRFSARIREILSNGHRDHTPAAGMCDGPDSCPQCLVLLKELHHEDLYLAIGCAGGDRIAWECFADDYLPLLRKFACQACKNCDAGEDLAQEIITVLLGESAAAGEKEGKPSAADQGSEDRGSAGAGGKLMTYNGRGSLAGWLRASVAHAAIDRFRRGGREVSLDEPAAPGPGLSQTNAGQAVPGEEALDARWGPILSRALEHELSSLSAHDRLFLNLYYLQGVSLKSIGRQFGVHEATASRRLERLRQEVRRRVERTLRKNYGLGSRDISSLWHWVCENENPALESVLQLSPAGRRKNVQGGVA